MKPRIRIPLISVSDLFADDSPRPGGAGFVLIGAFAIGLGLYVLALLITGG